MIFHSDRHFCAAPGRMPRNCRARRAPKRSGGKWSARHRGTYPRRGKCAACRAETPPPPTPFLHAARRCSLSTTAPTRRPSYARGQGPEGRRGPRPLAGSRSWVPGRGPKATVFAPMLVTSTRGAGGQPGPRTLCRKFRARSIHASGRGLADMPRRLLARCSHARPIRARAGGLGARGYRGGRSLVDPSLRAGRPARRAPRCGIGWASVDPGPGRRSWIGSTPGRQGALYPSAWGHAGPVHVCTRDFKPGPI
jgi:hypothetical protein